MTHQCDVEPHRLLDLLPGRSADDPRAAELRDHVRGCAHCREELEALRESWTELPAAAAVSPPARLRERVLAQARAAVEAPAPEPGRSWRALRRVTLSVGLGAAGAGLVVLALGLRGHLTVTDPVAAAWFAVLLAAGLGVVSYGLAEKRTAPGLRGLLAASLATFVGYTALSLLQPLPAAVDFCRVSVLGGGDLSRGSLCLVYLGVAALYSGVPAGLSGWRWDGRRPGWSTGLAAAGLFVLLAAPFLGLQLGLADLILTVSALVGLALGALAGGLVGGLARRRLGAVLGG